MNSKLKKIIAGILGTAVVAGGVIVSVNTKQPLTWQEYQTLIKVYQHEISISGGKIIIAKADNALLKKMNEKILKRDVTEGTVTIDRETLSAQEYRQLRDGLILKAQKGL